MSTLPGKQIRNPAIGIGYALGYFFHRNLFGFFHPNADILAGLPSEVSSTLRGDLADFKETPVSFETISSTGGW